MDLGISSPQIDEAERGFSFNLDSNLDMRMNQSQKLTASEIINHFDYDELVKILYDYGEEKFAKKIFEIDVEKLVREAGYGNGEFRVSFSFVKNYVGNENPKKRVWIHEVSPSRTEGRNRRYSLRDIALLRTVQKLVGEGINHAGIKRIIELESAMANMAVEVAQLRIEVDALLKVNPPKGLATRRRGEVIVYKEDK